MQVEDGDGQLEVEAQSVVVYVQTALRSSYRLVTFVLYRQCKHLWANNQRLLGGASVCFQSGRPFSRSHIKLLNA